MAPEHVGLPRLHRVNKDGLSEDEMRSLEDAARKLRLSQPWMDVVANGVRLGVDFHDQVNKSANRGSVSIGIDREGRREPEERVTWKFMGAPGALWADVVPKTLLLGGHEGP